jgi:hypothetical protein
LEGPETTRIPETFNPSSSIPGRFDKRSPVINTLPFPKFSLPIISILIIAIIASAFTFSAKSFDPTIPASSPENAQNIKVLSLSSLLAK